MPSVYISSTFTDLEEHRAAAYRALRQLRYDSVAMEDYVATDARPVDKCLDDVAASDIYICIVAWRYGYVPPDDNPNRLSVTEMEYRAAKSAGVPRLVFLLSESAPWPVAQTDMKTGENESGKRIEGFRAELKRGLLISEFDTPDRLAAAVAVAAQGAAAELALDDQNHVAETKERSALGAFLAINRLPQEQHGHAYVLWTGKYVVPRLGVTAKRWWRRRQARKLEARNKAEFLKSVHEAVEQATKTGLAP